MSKIISLIGQRFVLSNRLTSLSSCHLNQTSQLSSATFQYKSVQYTSEKRRPVGFKNNALFSPKRFLYDSQSLGIQSLEYHRTNKAQLYERDREGYVNRISKYLEDSSTQSILLEDLINMIGLAQNEQHLDLIEKMVVNIVNSQKCSVSGWGTAVMRLYYTMNQIDRAYNNIKDENFGDFFNSYSTYRIAMTMLFNNGQYDHVLDIYHDAPTKLKMQERLSHNNHPGLTVIALASLAKQNDPSAFEKAQEVYNEISEQKCSKYLRLRLSTFMSYIAVNQNQPTTALNLIAETPGKNYISLREIKALALIKLRRYEDVLYHIRESLVRGSQDQGVRRPILHQDTYDAVKSAEKDVEDESIRHELVETLDELKRSKLVQEGNLSTIVFAPILLPPKDNTHDNNRIRPQHNKF